MELLLIYVESQHAENGVWRHSGSEKKAYMFNDGWGGKSEKCYHFKTLCLSSPFLFFETMMVPNDAIIEPVFWQGIVLILVTFRVGRLCIVGLGPSFYMAIMSKL